MKKYKLSHEKVQFEFKRQLPVFYGTAIFLFLTVIIHIFSYATSSEKNFPLLLVSTLVIGWFILSFLRYARRIGRSKHNYELEIGEDRLIVRDFGIKKREITKQEIKSVQRTSPKGSLIIKTDNPKNQMRIPYLFDGFDEVIEHVRKWQEIQEVSMQKFHSKLILIMSFLAFSVALELPISLENQITIPMIFFFGASSMGLFLVYQFYIDELGKQVRMFSWLLIVPVITFLARILA